MHNLVWVVAAIVGTVVAVLFLVSSARILGHDDARAPGQPPSAVPGRSYADRDARQNAAG